MGEKTFDQMQVEKEAYRNIDGGNALDSLSNEAAAMALALSRAMGMSLNWHHRCEITEIMNQVHWDYVARRKEQDMFKQSAGASGAGLAQGQPLSGVRGLGVRAGS